MDSGNEVIIVDDSVATVTTNGINGTHEEAGAEMKTRSKSGDEESAKSKLRNTRAVVSQKSVVAPADEKVAVADDRKKNLRSSDSADDAKSTVKEGANTRNAAQEKNGSGFGAKKGKTVEDEKAVATPVAAIVTAASGISAAKKKNVDREDDSGINSRASSVSNDEVVGLRMRTRSTKSQEVASTSTPAKRAQLRASLSGNDFEDGAFDDELPSNSLKRKVHVYIEEMDDFDVEENGEPEVKRPSIGETVVNVLWSPFRAIGGKFSVALPRLKSQPKEMKLENGDDESAEQEIAPSEVEASAVEATADDRTEAKNISRTCRLM